MTRNEWPLAPTLLFAGKSLIHPDPAAVIGMILFLAFYACLMFWGSFTAPARAEAESAAREKEFSDMKATLHHVTLALGMRGTRIEKQG